MGKNAWDGCDAWDNRPKTLPQGLRILADWFDAVYEDQGKNDEVQQDLRRWAAEYEALEAKLNMLSDHERKIEAWENAAREITRYVKYITAELDELKAAIAAAKVKP